MVLRVGRLIRALINCCEELGSASLVSSKSAGRKPLNESAVRLLIFSWALSLKNSYEFCWVFSSQQLNMSSAMRCRVRVAK